MTSKPGAAGIHGTDGVHAGDGIDEFTRMEIAIWSYFAGM
jgi:hypothetical protein